MQKIKALRGILTLTLVLALVLSLAVVPALATGEHPFTDVAEDDWFYDAVVGVYEEELMTGMTDDTFSPDTTLSRAMLATVLWRLATDYAWELDAKSPFDDVAEGTWYHDAVVWASENGIVNGYGDGRFGPNDSVTREQMLVMLYRYVELEGGGFEGTYAIWLQYEDLEEASDWALEAVTYFTISEAIHFRTDNMLEPKSPATRAEVAYALYRLVEDLSEAADTE